MSNLVSFMNYTADCPKSKMSDEEFIQIMSKNHKITQLTPQLYIAGYMGVSDEDLKNFNINLIINVTKDLSLFHCKNRNYSSIPEIRIPVEDIVGELLYPYFQPICNLMYANELHGGSNLIHCQVGQSRAATLCIAYILWKQDGRNNLKEVLNFVQQKRPQIQPNKGFLLQLEKWDKRLKEKGSLECETQLLNDQTQSALQDIVNLTSKINSSDQAIQSPKSNNDILNDNIIPIHRMETPELVPTPQCVIS